MANRKDASEMIIAHKDSTMGAIFSHLGEPSGAGLAGTVFSSVLIDALGGGVVDISPFFDSSLGSAGIDQFLR